MWLEDLVSIVSICFNAVAFNLGHKWVGEEKRDEKERKKERKMPVSPMSVMQIRERDHMVYHLLSTEGGINHGERIKTEDQRIMLEKLFFFL